MSGNVRAFAPTFGAKKEVVVTAVATAAQHISKMAGGPLQVRISNYDTVRVAYRFGGSTVVADLAADPTLGPGRTEIVTVLPPQTGPGDIYFSVISDAAPTGNKFEATPGQGI